MDGNGSSKGTKLGCLRRANLPEGREASLGAVRTMIGPSKKGSFEGVEGASACEGKVGGDGWRLLRRPERDMLLTLLR